MKANEILNIVLGLVILIIIGLAAKMIFFSPEPVHVIDTVTVTDTTTVHDTIYVPKSVNISKLKAKLSKEIKDSLTIYFNQIGKDTANALFAMADTTFKKDSSKVSIRYYFPPLNFFAATFDIKEKIIKQFQTVTETKTITVELPFYRQITFWTTIGAMLLLFFVK